MMNIEINKEEAIFFHLKPFPGPSTLQRIQTANRRWKMDDSDRRRSPTVADPFTI